MTAIAILQFSPLPAYFGCGWVKSSICALPLIKSSNYFINITLVCDDYRFNAHKDFHKVFIPG